MGLMMLLGNQFQNGALARYPDAATELAVFAIAISIFHMFDLALEFAPQTVNTLGRSRQARRLVLRFLVAVGVVFTVLLSIVGYTRFGQSLLATFFNLSGDMLRKVLVYLRVLSPLLLINAFRHFCIGLLIQVRFTGIVTLLNGVYLAAIISILVLGFRLGWPALRTVSASILVASTAHLVLSLAAVRFYYDREDDPDAVPIDYREVMRFFWLVSVTSIVFGLSRPLIYVFVSRTPNATEAIAALRVSFELVHIFQNAVNQLRNFFVTFGFEDLSAVRWFAIKIMLGVIAMLLLIAATPIGNFIFQTLLGVKGEILKMAREVFWVFALMPVVIALRNYMHGLMMVHRQTRGMALAGVARLVAIGLGSWALYVLGWLTATTAAATLLLGFIVEATMVVGAVWLRPVNTPPVARAR